MRYSLVLICCLFLEAGYCQYDWKLEKEKKGISVFLSKVKGSDYKAVKVECTLTGTYAKLISILTNVKDFHKWIYNNSSSSLLKQNTALDFTYYSVTGMPWPVSNRDVVIHLKINTDSLPKFMTITGVNEKNIIPEVPTRVRVPYYKASWKVTMPSPQSIHISYIVELDPGGSLPAGIVNSYADKGPLGTFSNLAEELKK